MNPPCGHSVLIARRTFSRTSVGGPLRSTLWASVLLENRSYPSNCPESAGGAIPLAGTGMALIPPTPSSTRLGSSACIARQEWRWSLTHALIFWGLESRSSLPHDDSAGIHVGSSVGSCEGSNVSHRRAKACTEVHQLR